MRLLVLLLLSTPLLMAAEIDWQRVRKLLDRQQTGASLDAEERQVLTAARRERRRLLAAGNWPPPGFEDHQPAPAPAGRLLSGSTTGLVPLTDLGVAGYRGESGGLYGDGANVLDAKLVVADARIQAGIVPRDGDGKPTPSEAGGRIGLLSVGMSNTAQIFAAFIDQMRDGDGHNTAVVPINGALHSHDAEHWGSGNDADPWIHIDAQIQAADLTAEQVQAVWLLHAIRLPQRTGDFPEHTLRLKAELMLIIHKLHRRFPHLRVVHCSSRSYAGWDTQRRANPEPYAYESAFAVRDLITDQLAGVPDLNPDPAAGPVHAPLLRWGPYLWVDGTTARADGLVFERADFHADGIHPAPQGRHKMTRLLMDFYTTDPATEWFRP